MKLLWLLFFTGAQSRRQAGTATPRPRAKSKVSKVRAAESMTRGPVLHLQVLGSSHLEVAVAFTESSDSMRAAFSFQGLVKPFSVRDKQASCLLYKI